MAAYRNPTGTFDATDADDSFVFDTVPAGYGFAASIDAKGGSDSLLVQIGSAGPMTFDASDAFNDGSFYVRVGTGPYGPELLLNNIENVDFRGSAANDTFSLRLGSSTAGLSVNMDGGDGLDRLDFDWSKLTTGMSFVVTGTSISTNWGTFSNFERFELHGGSGNDTFTTGAADDAIYTGAGVDTVSVGAGNDYVYSESSGGTFDGGTGHDYFGANLSALTSPVTATIGTTLRVGAITATDFESFGIGGGSGNDVFTVESAPNGGTLDGGAGSDTLRYNIVPTTALQLSMEAAGDQLFGTVGPIGSGLSFNSFERVSLTGSQLDDTFSIRGSYTGAGLLFDAGAGTDTLILDCAYSTTAVNLTVGSTGAVSTSLGTLVSFEKFSIVGGHAADVLTGGAYADTFIGGRGADQLSGGGGDDLLIGNDGYSLDDGAADKLVGGAGNDTISAGVGDTVDGGTGTDLLDIDLRAATAGISADFSRLTGGASIQLGGATLTGVERMGVINGTDLADSLVMGTSGGGAQLYGWGGNDVLRGGSNAETILGGTGNDTLSGGLGQDTLNDSEGDDLFRDTAAGLNGDRIVGFGVGDKLVITDVNLSSFSFQLTGNQLVYSGGTLTIDSQLPGHLVASAAVGGGVQLEVRLPPVATPDQIASQLTAGYFDGDTHHWNVSPGGALTVNISMLGAAEQSVARQTLQLWTDVSGIQFREVTSGGQIRFDNSDAEGAYSDVVWSQGVITSAVVHIPSYYVSTFGAFPGGDGFEVYVHEIGHALGLGHAGNYNFTGTYADDALFANDSLALSVMSYFDMSESYYFATRNFSNYGVATPMQADILAIQSLYGVSAGTRTGDTVYGYGATAGEVYDAGRNGGVALTIFDSGGVDTLNYANVYYSQFINLNPETFSNVNAGTGNLSIARGTIIENAVGGMGADTLIGNDAANILTGGTGADVLVGGLGSDTFRDTAEGLNGDTITDFSAGDRIVIANASLATFDSNLSGNVLAFTGGTLVLTASAGTIVASAAAGGGVQLMLQAASTDDVLVSGPGVDSLDGGGGSDTYIIAADADHGAAEIHDSGATGTDEVRFTATVAGTLTLFAGDTGIERVVIGTGTGATAALSGTTANNVDARALGNGVTMVGNAGANTLTATAFDDLLQGGVGIDRLVGNAGNDKLDGGRDADKLLGGAGDDIYVVDNTSDAVIELAGEGRDTVQASVAVTLKANVEDLVQAGIYSVHATGNALANAMTGNSGSNKLYGMGGDDTLAGGGGNDLLDGGTGNDLLTGGIGNDSYVVDSAGDTVSEAAGEGYDLIKASLGWTLGDNLERLDLTGTAAINGSGNGLANVLNGNDAANSLFGLAGNDKLYGRGGDDLVDGGDGTDWLEGGAGLDVMIGGSGGDRFVFRTGDFASATASGCDVIRDYSYASGDRIRLDLLDADSTVAGTQDFAFIGTGAFTGVAGQLRYQQLGGNTFVSADTDGDGDADLMVQLDGLHTLKVGDFIL